LEEAYTLLINRLDLEKENTDWVDLYLLEANRIGTLLGYDKIVRLASEAPIGPTNADIIEASKLNALETSAFINSMVSGLVEKLKAEPDDIDGWLRLSRSYIVLKNLAPARESLKEAKNLIEKLPKNNPKIETYNQLLVDLEDIQ
jgi:cytochrome c-type biogenesis protein CcmH